MWQQVIIALLVVFAAGYVTWTFLPMMRRQRLLDALAAQHRARLSTPGCSNCAAAGEHAPKIARSGSTDASKRSRRMPAARGFAALGLAYHGRLCRTSPWCSRS